MKKMNNKGFSLVELIIVIAIMAILIAVLAPQYIKYVEKSRESADLDNWQSVLSAMQVAYADVDNPVTSAQKVECTAVKGHLSADTDIDNAMKALGTDVSGITMKSQKYAVAELNATVTSGVVTITCTNADLKAQLGLN